MTMNFPSSIYHCPSLFQRTRVDKLIIIVIIIIIINNNNGRVVIFMGQHNARFSFLMIRYNNMIIG